MLSEGVEPGWRAYAALTRAHLQEDRLGEAQKWMTRMRTWSNWLPPRSLVSEMKEGRAQAAVRGDTPGDAVAPVREAVPAE